MIRGRMNFKGRNIISWNARLSGQLTHDRSESLGGDYGNDGGDVSFNYSVELSVYLKQQQ